MQKILLIICAILTTTSANATQMCARRDTTVIPLDAVIHTKTTGNGSDSTEWMWWASFLYGNVYGISTCLSLPEGQEYLPTWGGGLGGGIILDTDIYEIQGRSGSYVASDGTLYPRRYCFCKLTHPISSQWIQTNGNDASTSEEKCKSNCASGCVGGFSSVLWGIDIRNNLYNSVGIGYVDINDKEYKESIDL